jgi:hypothetical protein
MKELRELFKDIDIEKARYDLQGVLMLLDAVALASDSGRHKYGYDGINIIYEKVGEVLIEVEKIYQAYYSKSQETTVKQ